MWSNQDLLGQKQETETRISMQHHIFEGSYATTTGDQQSSR
jgi:hypothetical protein